MARGKYTVNEVEERTGVPATTLRQWERRYGLPMPERSDSGYRMYGDDDIADIRTMKAHVADGVPASRAAEMVKERVRPGSGPRPVAALRTDLVDALVALDDDRADRVLSEAHALHTVEAVVLELLGGAMHDLGTLWHDGKIATTTEHFASSYVHGRLRALLALSGGHRGGPSVIVACAPLDQHELGALTLAVMLRRSGYQVYYVGANTPVEDLAAMARDLQPFAVMISASSLDSIHQLVAKRRHLEGIAPVLALGGYGFNAEPALAEKVGGQYLGATVVEALDRLGAEVRHHGVLGSFAERRAVPRGAAGAPE
jgi:MerR family transcriptional regulator, light-induced transcriptional regulator